MSSISEPVGMASTGSTTRSPMRITEPLPNCFSIWLSAADSARFLFSSIGFVLVVDFVDFVDFVMGSTVGVSYRKG